MADIVDIEDLTSWPGVVLRSDGTNALVLQLTNGLIHDIIGAYTPIPTWVQTLALKVAARSLANPENFSSVTTQIDDWKKTVRYREGADFDPEDVGVYLSDSESAKLRRLVNGTTTRGVGSIRLKVPGYAADC